MRFEMSRRAKKSASRSSQSLGALTRKQVWKNTNQTSFAMLQQNCANLSMPKTKTESLSVITYNILYGKKLDKIAAWLAAHPTKFDIICFQEFPFHKIDEFLKVMEPHSLAYTFSPGFTNKKGHYGQLTAYNRKKMKLLKQEIVDLPHSSFWEEKVFKNKGKRTALFTTFLYKRKKITLINTHLLCLVLNRTRRKQITKIIEALEKSENLRPKDPVVLLGDFNYTSLIKQKNFFQFMDQFNLQNAYKSPTIGRFFVKHQVDYVFSRNCNAQDVEIPHIKFSDHYPIQFRLEV